MTQQTAGSWIDIYATVIDILEGNERKLRKQEEGQATRLLKTREVVLREGDVKELLEMVGMHASIPLKIGDRVAIRGCKVEEYRFTRKLTTSYVTYIEVNPLPNSNLPALSPLAEEVEPKKAMMADGVGSNLQTYSVQDAVNEVYHMVHRLTTEYGTIPTRKNVAVVGKLQTFSERFFDDSCLFSAMMTIQR